MVVSMGLIYVKSLSWKFTFGKYKNEPIGKIIYKDPQYILWANRKVNFISISRLINRRASRNIRLGIKNKYNKKLIKVIW